MKKKPIHIRIKRWIDKKVNSIIYRGHKTCFNDDFCLSDKDCTTCGFHMNDNLMEVAHLTTDDKMKLIHKMVNKNRHYYGEDYHDRWTSLYNVYDIVFKTDIRADHNKFKKANRSKISRIEYIEKIGNIDRLLYVASVLYKNEFDHYRTAYLIY